MLRADSLGMTETPSGSYDREQNDTSTSPLGGRPPYGGPEWRREDAAGTQPQGPRYGSAAGSPQYAAPAAPGQDGAAQVQGGQVGAAPAGTPQYAAPAAPGQGGAAQVPAAPVGAVGSGFSGAYGASRYPYGGGAVPPANGSPWPYAAPEPAKRARGGKRLIAVAAVTAVLGGLVGGGAVALLDPGSTNTVTASGLTVEGGSAPTVATQAGTVEAAAATAMKSVVTLAVRGSQESGTGSGIVIRSDGYILTNEHVTAVADGGGSITVEFADGRQATATLVGADKATDLAVVKVDLTGLTAATFADSDTVKVGQTVVAVGSPLGLDGTVTEGIVSALHRPTTGASDNSAVIDALQTDAAINPGNSGGALVDLAGRVVGINQSIATASSGSQYGQSTSSGNIGIGFAIPSATAARIAGELIASGTATHAFLGVQTQSATDQNAGTTVGATISTVEAGGPAAAAGLKTGDVVVKVGDRVVGESDELVAAVRSYAPGTKVALTIRRGTATQTISVTLGSDAKQ
jgi:putative serine protease PepD